MIESGITVDCFRLEGNVLPKTIERQWLELIQTQDRCVSPLCYPDYCNAVSEVRDDVEVGLVHRFGQLIALIVYHRIGPGAVDIGDQTSDQSVFLVKPGEQINFSFMFEALKLQYWKFTHLAEVPRLLKRSVQYWDENFQVDLTNGFECYCDQLRENGSKIEKEIARKYRKLEREVGQIEFRFRDDSLEAVEFLLTTKNRQLQDQYGDSILEESWVQSFVKSLHSNQKEGGFSALSTLRAGNQLVAAHLGMSAGSPNDRTFNSWIPVVNSAFYKYSPGSQLMWQILQSAEAEGVKIFDLGRGQNQLKKRLSNKIQKMAVGRFGSNLKWNAVSKLEGWLRNAKSKLPKLQRLPKESLQFLFRSF